MMSNEVRDFVKNKLHVVSNQNIEQKKLTDGRSGADVYSIKVKSNRERLSGYYIVKVSPSAEEQGGNEAERASGFCAYSKGFSEHLVKNVASEQIDGKNVIIYQQANKSRLCSTAFSALDGTRLARYARCVSKEILSVLNKEYWIDGTVEDFFRSLLSKQLGESGRFTTRMKELLVHPDAQCVALNKAIYPNPFYFMTHVEYWCGLLTNLSLFKGATHGDLHGLNLLASEEGYAMIDYDSASVDSYLLFDQAYFELSVFLDNSKDNDLKLWNVMLEHLVRPSVFQQVGSCEYYLEFMVRNAVCQGITDWIKETGLENQRDDIELQFLLARIAAGINFFCKKSCVEQGKQIKILFFICFCLKSLFEKIGLAFDENDVSTLSLSSAFTDTEDLWDNVFRFRDYVPVLITDDGYTTDDFKQLSNISVVRWGLVVDAGFEEEEPIVYKSLLENVKTESVKRIALLSDESTGTFYNTLNVLSIRKPVDMAYTSLWRNCGRKLLSHLERFLSNNPQVPLVLVFDCGKDSLPFRDQLIDRLCDLPLPGATRFVTLRTGLSESFSNEMADLEKRYRWRFSQFPGASLLHAAQCCGLYLQELQTAEQSVDIPSIDGYCTFSKEDLVTFSSSIELIYAGCEYAPEHKLVHMGVDMSGAGDSLGEVFYKGGEATWNDIANHRDLRLLTDIQYQSVKKRILKLAEESSPRIRKIRLIHGAGTGGTTLSKRILWDLKLDIPCVRLKKYVPETVDMLLEIYKRTGKRVLLTVEQGSTVITDDELNMLVQQTNAENGKLLILLITRAVDSASHASLEEEKNVIVRLNDTMPASISADFMERFSRYAELRDNSSDRIRLLKMITGDASINQRTPFFYGFYAFQEEYNLLDRLQSTVSICTPDQRNLLNCLALATKYSQNICVTFSESLAILGIEDNDSGILNIYAWMDSLPSAISKLIVIREKGFRLCHQIIAEKLLLLLHTAEEPYMELKYVVYSAVRDYVQTLSRIYDGGNERVDEILRELVIDRATIDADDQKTKFSPLVEEIPNWTDKEALFRLLIEKFPENPHYYNHLARLLAFGDKKANINPQYKKAIEVAKQAIDVSEKTGDSTSTHRTTLGCIYGHWLLHDIKEEIRNRQRGMLSLSYEELIETINLNYSLAREEFECARMDSKIHDSFNYFPQIHMEYRIIDYLVKFDNGRTMQQLIEQEPSFKLWYDEHFCIATELLLKMSDLLNNNPSLLREAKEKLGTISSTSIDSINTNLHILLNSNIRGYKRRRRSLIYGAFVTNGCNWKGLDARTCELAEQSLRKNIIDFDDGHKNADIETWFELYRRCKYFQPAEAQHIIADYMEESYRKSYLLFLLAFIQLEAGVAGSSPSAVERCIKEAHQLARQHGINTTREHDCFVNSSVAGCPIELTADVARDESGNPIGLKSFTGRVIEVEHTYGKILLDNLNLEVIFIPNPTTVNRDESRTIARRDIHCKVKLNLMFSYSGLRGWDVMKLD